MHLHVAKIVSTDSKRGDIFYADLDPIIGSEQGGIRPVLVVQNNVGNKYSATVVVLPISSAKKNYPMCSILQSKFRQRRSAEFINGADEVLW